MSEAAKTAIDALTGPVSRRGFIGCMGALPVAGVAVSGAASAMTASNLSIYKGEYAIDSKRVVQGYFAAPRGRQSLDIVLVLPGEGMTAAQTEAKARGFAAQGWLAIAPDLPKTYRGAALGGRPALVAAMMRDLPRFKAMARGSGKVVVAA